jgi:hypothetical protein
VGKLVGEKGHIWPHLATYLLFLCGLFGFQRFQPCEWYSIVNVQVVVVNRDGIWFLTRLIIAQIFYFVIGIMIGQLYFHAFLPSKYKNGGFVELLTPQIPHSSVLRVYIPKKGYLQLP